jgi:hypothetical protein
LAKREGSPPPDDDELYRGDWLTIRAMRRKNGAMPAAEWYDSLEDKGQIQFLSAAKILETSLRYNRPPAGRAEKVAGSRTGLWEMRVTPKGGTAPHLRVLYVREGNTLWAAMGFTKQKNALAKSDITMGDNICREWRNEE